MVRCDGERGTPWRQRSRARPPERSAVSSGPGRRGSAPSTAATRTLSPTTRSARSRRPRCQARTRVYRDGRLVKQGFPVAADQRPPGRHRHHDLARPARPRPRRPAGAAGRVRPAPGGDRGRAVRPRAAEDRPVRDAPVHDRLQRPARHHDRRARHQRAVGVHPPAGADHHPQGRRAGHWQGRRALGLQPRPGQPRRRLPALRTARLHRGRPLRGGAVARRRGRGARGQPVRRHAQEHVRAPAVLRTAQVPGAAAPDRAPDAGGAEHPDAAGRAASSTPS